MKGSAGWAKAKEGSGIGEGTAEAIAKEAGAALTFFFLSQDRFTR